MKHTLLGKICRSTHAPCLRGGLLAMAAACGMALMALGAEASVRDSRIDAARLCTQNFPTNERMNGIPTHLLAAIASTESGRWNDTLGMVIPWPWTINAAGKGYYFDTKAEAIAKAKSLRAQGINSMDVGCMQVNLKHHPRAFANLEQAFDPAYNVGYAARFLRRNYADLKSWTRATAAYHSRTPVHGNRYLGLVQKSWNTIMGKLRMARAKQGIAGDVAYQVSPAQEQAFAQLQREFDARDAMTLPSDVLTNAAPRRQNAKAARARAQMKVITVRDAPDRSNTMIVRPRISGETPDEGAPVSLTADAGEALQEVAMATPGLVSSYGGSNRVTNRMASANSSGKVARTGAKFVFVE